MTELLHCQSCGAAIALADVNVANDIALCRACGQTMRFSEIAPIPGAAEVDLQRPPKGVRIDDSPLRGRSIIYRKISPAVLFLIPFTALWSGGSAGPAGWPATAVRASASNPQPGSATARPSA